MATKTKRPRRVTENDEYFAAARRFVRRAGVRVAGGDIESLAELVKLREIIDEAEAVAVAGLLSDNVYTMTDLARVLKVTRQYAWRRYHHLQPKDSAT